MGQDYLRFNVTRYSRYPRLNLKAFFLRRAQLPPSCAIPGREDAQLDSGHVKPGFSRPQPRPERPQLRSERPQLRLSCAQLRSERAQLRLSYS